MDSGGVRREGANLCRATLSQATEPISNCASPAEVASSKADDTFKARERDFSSHGCQDVRVLSGPEHNGDDVVVCSTGRPVAEPSLVQPSGSGVHRNAELLRERHVDVFGNQHPPVATDLIDCFQCGRPVAAGRFAPHLHKCLGKGRMASRQASRAWMNMAPKSHAKDKPSSKASSAQAAAAPAPVQAVSQPRSEALPREGRSAQPKPTPAEAKGEEGKRTRQPLQQTSIRTGPYRKGSGQGRDAAGRSLRASRKASASVDCPASRTRSRFVQGGDSTPNQEEAQGLPAQPAVYLQRAGGGGTDPGCVVEASAGHSPRALLRTEAKSAKVSTFQAGSSAVQVPGEAYFLEAADLKTTPELESPSALPGLTAASGKQVLKPKLELGVPRAVSPVPSDGTSTTTAETCRESLSPCSVHEEHHAQGLQDEHGISLDGYDPILETIAGTCACLPASIPTRKRRGRIAAIDTTYVRQLKLRDH